MTLPQFSRYAKPFMFVLFLAPCAAAQEPAPMPNLGLELLQFNSAAADLGALKDHEQALDLQIGSLKKYEKENKDSSDPAVNSNLKQAQLMLKILEQRKAQLIETLAQQQAEAERGKSYRATEGRVRKLSETSKGTGVQAVQPTTINSAKDGWQQQPIRAATSEYKNAWQQTYGFKPPANQTDTSASKSGPSEIKSKDDWQRPRTVPSKAYTSKGDEQ